MRVTVHEQKHTLSNNNKSGRLVSEDYHRFEKAPCPLGGLLENGWRFLSGSEGIPPIHLHKYEQKSPGIA